jgi:hypothetical protein
LLGEEQLRFCFLRKELIFIFEKRWWLGPTKLPDGRVTLSPTEKKEKMGLDVGKSLKGLANI